MFRFFGWLLCISPVKILALAVRLTLAGHNTCCNNTKLILAKKKSCRLKQRLLYVTAYIAMNGLHAQFATT